MTDQEVSTLRGRIIKGVIAFILLVVVLMVQPFTYENVDAGNAGIKLNLYGSDRGVDNIALVSGRVWYNSWNSKVVEFPIYTQTVDYTEFAVFTSETSEFNIDPTLTFTIDEKLVPHIYRTYRKSLDEITKTFIKNEMFNSYREVAGKYTADSLMAHRSIFEKQVETALNTRINGDGFLKCELTAAIHPPTALVAIINAKNASTQARIKANNEVAQAEAEGKVAKTRAEANATAMLVQARAEAEANRLKQITLTPLLLQQQLIAGWVKNGSPTPQIITGGGSGQIWQMPALKTKD